MTSAEGEEGFSRRSVRRQEGWRGLISPLEYGSRDLITDERTESRDALFANDSSLCKSLSVIWRTGRPLYRRAARSWNLTLRFQRNETGGDAIPLFN